MFAAAISVAILFYAQFVHAGAADYQSPGSYTFTVPGYSSLTVQVWGAGGGGGTNNGVGYNASSGGQSSFGSVVASGGAGGGGSYGGGSGAGGSGGTAYGGSTNSAGGAGIAGGSDYEYINCLYSSGASLAGGAGGSSPNGGSGGASAPANPCISGAGGVSGSAPGGGGSGGSGTCSGDCIGAGGGGGGGGYASATYGPGQLAVGSGISVYVGGGGGSAPYGDYPGGSGANGRVYISWTDPPPATCSVSLSPNPKSYAGSATLSWSSSNAHYSVYINNVGYVGSSGSTSVAPTSNTDYSCYANGYGGSDGWHGAILYVNAPSNCTAPWGSTVNHGSSVTAYQASTVPYGSTCNSQTRTCSNGTLSGSYAYATCIVNDPPPTCTPSTSYTCSGQSIIQTDVAADCEETETTLDTCDLPEFCTAGSATCLYTAPSGNITASPRLVASGKTTTISWTTTDAESCTVSGTNGDTWTGTNASRTSSPITQVVYYTIQCDDADPDTTEDDYSDRVTVVRVPSWLEF